MSCFANLLVTSKTEKCLMSDMIIKSDLLIFLYTLTISHVSLGNKSTTHHIELEFSAINRIPHFLIELFFLVIQKGLENFLRTPIHSLQQTSIENSSHNRNPRKHSPVMGLCPP